MPRWSKDHFVLRFPLFLESERRVCFAKHRRVVSRSSTRDNHVSSFSGPKSMCAQHTVKWLQRVFTPASLRPPKTQTSLQVSVNESCSASVKTDLLRRLRRLNQGQRRATRVEASARCSLCLLPLAGPPRGAPVGNRPPTAGRGWGRERARGVAPARGGGGGGRGGASGAGRGEGSYMFPCGHMFHAFCLGVARERGASKGKRGGGREGTTAGGVVCVLCSGRGKSGRR